MSIFSGSSKIGKIYMGETSIGKVYKGSELVWQKGNGIQYYGYDGCLLLATNDTSGFLVSSISLPIKTISGTLGNSAGTKDIRNSGMTGRVSVDCFGRSRDICTNEYINNC